MNFSTEELLDIDRDRFPDADTIAPDSPRSISTELDFYMSRRLQCDRTDLCTVIDLTGDTEDTEDTEEAPIKKRKREERCPYAPSSPGYGPNSPAYAPSSPGYGPNSPAYANNTSYCCLSGEYSTDKERADELLCLKACVSPCTPFVIGNMIGRTWWKRHGYNTPCACAVKALQRTIGRNNITGFV